MAPEFFGLVTQDWPVRTGTSGGNGPTFPVRSIATSDCNAVHWRTLHTAANTINWTPLDTFVARAQAAGITRGCYFFYGTPTFLASTGAAVLGPYGGLGEGAYPNDLAQVTYFTQQFGIRNRTVWNGFFKYAQIGNELDFLTTPGISSFWWGTRPQWTDHAYTAYQGFKAGDPSIDILSPGTYDMSIATGFQGWIGISGTVNPTIKAYQTFDKIATHPYHARPEGYSGLGNTNGCTFGGLRLFDTYMLAAGSTVRNKVITEWGISSQIDAELTTFLATTSAFKATLMAKLVLSWLASGVEAAFLFSLGNNNNLSGNLDVVTLNGVLPDPTGTIAGWTRVFNAVAGKTLSQIGYYDNGAWAAVSSTGSTYYEP